MFFLETHFTDRGKLLSVTVSRVGGILFTVFFRDLQILSNCNKVDSRYYFLIPTSLVGEFLFLFLLF